MDPKDFIKRIFNVNFSEEKVESLINVCDLQDIEFVEGKSSDSSSPTDTLFVTLKDPVGNPFKLFMKTFILKRNESENDNPLIWETYYYSFVTSKIYKAQLCRNVLPMIAHSSKCNVPYFETFLTKGIKGDRSAKRVKETSASFKRNLSFMVNSERGRPSLSDPEGPSSISTGDRLDEIDALGFIVTHQVSNDLERLALCPGFPKTIPENPIFDFGDLLQAMIDSLDKERAQEASQHIHLLFVQYMFQVMFALHTFSDRFQLNQNDLHLGNILMDRCYPGESPIHRYVLPQHNIETYIMSDTIPRIFDFDRATSRERPNQSLDESFEETGQSKAFSPLRDVVKVLAIVHKYIRYHKYIPAVDDMGITLALLTMPEFPSGASLSFSGYSSETKDAVDRYLKSTYGLYTDDFMKIKVNGRNTSILSEDSDLSTFAAKTDIIVQRFMQLMNTRPGQADMERYHARLKGLYTFHTSGESEASMPPPPKPRTVHIFPKPNARPAKPDPIFPPADTRPVTRAKPAPIEPGKHKRHNLAPDALIARPKRQRHGLEPGPRAAKRPLPPRP